MAGRSWTYMRRSSPSTRLPLPSRFWSSSSMLSTSSSLSSMRGGVHCTRILQFLIFFISVQSLQKKYMPTSSIAFLFFLKLKSYSAQALLARLEEPLFTDLCFPAITRCFWIWVELNQFRWFEYNCIEVKASRSKVLLNGKKDISLTKFFTNQFGKEG